MPWNVNPDGDVRAGSHWSTVNNGPQFQRADTAGKHPISIHLHKSWPPLTCVGVVDCNVTNCELLVSNLNADVS